MHELIGIAVRATSMSAVRDVLRAIAEKTDSYGCILWRVTPADPGDRPHLFVAADWFGDEPAALNHELSMDSHTGAGIMDGVQRVVAHAGVVDGDRFLLEQGVTTFCATPLIFADGVAGSLNLYRRGSVPYDAATAAVAGDVAATLPAVLRVIEDEVSLRLLRTFDGALRTVTQDVARHVSLFDHIAPQMGSLCREIANALNCIETSVFLEDYFEAPGSYRLAGTTWLLPLFKTSYGADEADGITGWVLAHPDRKVILFDLWNGAEVETYPGMRWLDSLDVRRSLASHPKVRDLGHLPPLSFMSVPIMDGDAVVGAIRCMAGLGPVYFDERQHAMLVQIATRIGSFWNALVRNRSLETLVKSVNELNGFAHAELMKSHPNDDLILTEALRITNNVIPGAEITDVRLLNDDKTELRFRVPYGDAWSKGTPEDAELRMSRVFRVNHEPPSSAGAHVVQTGDLYVVRDTKADPYYTSTFPETKRMIIAPLTLRSRRAQEGETFGVLDIRTSIDRDFPDFAVAVAELLSSQLALYRKLAFVIRDLNQSVRDLKALRDQQVQINADLSHQLKSPTMTAHRRVNDLLRGMPESELKSQLLRIRGVCARAMHVAANSWLFARLARGEEIPVHKERLTGDELLRLIISTAQDASYMALGAQRDTFFVEPEGLHAIGEFHTDRNLLEQALTQLLDNAFKYSFREARVIATGGYTRSSRRDARKTDSSPARLRISVISVGVALDRHSAAKCIERGWQAEEAKSVSDTGSGLGLWIVRHIMDALAGSLEVVPTDDHGQTAFSLVLPVH